MDQTKAPAPAQKPAKKPAQGPPQGPAKDSARDYAWHRHPALIAAIPVVGALIGSVLTIVAGQKGALPESINPAPPPTTVIAQQTTTATVTATETVTESVTPPPTEEPPGSDGPTSPPVQPIGGGTLAITVGLSNGGKIGPAEYRVGSVPHAYAEVRDGSGVRLISNCYLTWTLKRGSSTILSSRTETCDAWFNYTRDSLSVRGLYHVTVSVVTDAGPTGTKTLDFKVT